MSLGLPDEAVEAGAMQIDPGAFTGEGYSPSAAEQSAEDALAKSEAVLTAGLAALPPEWMLAKALTEDEIESLFKVLRANGPREGPFVEAKGKLRSALALLGDGLGGRDA